MWGKGKKVGLRIFWDGIITNEKKFYRRRKAFGAISVGSLIKPSYLARPEEMSRIFIGNYMKTKSPGKWTNF